MIRILFILFICFLFPYLGYSQSESRPRSDYLGILLIEEPTTERMVEICDYYGLTEKPSKDGFLVYSHPDGTEFQFKVEEIGNRKYPTVRVITPNKNSSIEKVLNNAGYVKSSDGYIKGSEFEYRRTRCRTEKGSKNTLIFTKEYTTLYN